MSTTEYASAAVDPYEMVKEFHEAFGAPIHTGEPRLEFDRLALRIDLVVEEMKEVKEAIDNRDVSNLAKELADVVYVIYGWAIEAGIPLDKVFQEVHRSNMSKLGEDGKPVLREDGKVLKGKNYSPADIDSILWPMS